jgi:hypothetical protein
VKYICVFFVLFLTPIAASAAGLDIEKGNADLLKSQTLSRPFSMFDQLLYSLAIVANENANYFKAEKKDFTPWTHYYPSANVTYEKEIARVAVTFPVTVSHMNDPWRQVCEQHARNMAMDLGVLGLGSQAAHPNPDMKTEGIRQFFSRHLGPSVLLDNMLIASLQPFLDAMVVIVDFSVQSSDKKGLVYFRQCALDIKNDRMKYNEYRY